MNTIETATIIQSELDKAAVEQATSGWMEVNEKLVKYTGGAEVKIPSLDMDGMADYDRTSNRNLLRRRKQLFVCLPVRKLISRPMISL